MGLDKRWTDMEKHEDYCAGHLMEAAVAYYNTTGKRKLLEVAVRLADHMDATFRQQNRPWVSGHQEVELALVKLARTTGDKKYVELADWFLDQRGRGHGKGMIWSNPHMGPKYCQDDVPVRDQKEITGHAVRAMYLYTGAADVGAAKNDAGYMQAMKTVWEDVVNRNMYITGGIGSSGRNEGFRPDYDLPNESAYCETCASVGMVFWNQRMNLLTGESKYVDVLERSLYNGRLDGLSLSGDRFFYGNPWPPAASTPAANGSARPAVPPTSPGWSSRWATTSTPNPTMRSGSTCSWAVPPPFPSKAARCSYAADPAIPGKARCRLPFPRSGKPSLPCWCAFPGGRRTNQLPAIPTATPTPTPKHIPFR
jgi:hypothetical protein